MTTAHAPGLERWQKRTEWPLAVVALIFLAAYSVRVLAQPQGRSDTAMEVIIWTTWAAFAIVVLPLLRPLRLLRLVVLVTALEKAIGGAIRGRVVIYTASSVVLLVYVASLAILQTERYQPGSDITTFGNAVWWSITTITTVGYGDLAPVTTTGRMVAVTLMIGGISLVGVVTATLASWVIEQVAEEDIAQQAAASPHIDDLRADVEKQMDGLRAEIRQLADATKERDAPER